MWPLLHQPSSWLSAPPKGCISDSSGANWKLPLPPAEAKIFFSQPQGNSEPCMSPCPCCHCPSAGSLGAALPAEAIFTRSLPPALGDCHQPCAAANEPTSERDRIGAHQPAPHCCAPKQGALFPHLPLPPFSPLFPFFSSSSSCFPDVPPSVPTVRSVPAVLGPEPWGGAAELRCEHRADAGQPVVSRLSLGGEKVVMGLDTLLYRV